MTTTGDMMVMQFDQKAVRAIHPLSRIGRPKHFAFGAFDVEFQDVESLGVEQRQQITDPVARHIATGLALKRPTISLRVGDA